MTQRIPLLVILLLPVAICGIAWYFWYSPVTTIFLVRHAERLNATDTTSLSVEGITRSKSLAHALSSSGIRKIFVSEKIRTQQTASPIAAEMGITPIRIPAQQIKRYVDSIKSNSGEAILLVGHSDTLPLLLGKLGISQPPSIESDEFDRIFVVTS